MCVFSFFVLVQLSVFCSFSKRTPFFKNSFLLALYSILLFSASLFSVHVIVISYSPLDLVLASKVHGSGMGAHSQTFPSQGCLGCMPEVLIHCAVIFIVPRKFFIFSPVSSMNHCSFKYTLLSLQVPVQFLDLFGFGFGFGWTFLLLVCRIFFFYSGLVRYKKTSLVSLYLRRLLCDLPHTERFLLSSLCICWVTVC